MKKTLSFFICLSIVLTLSAQPKPIKLWKGVSKMNSQPTKLYIYPAPDSTNTGIAVIVCPGGSYSHTMGIATEGFAVAEWLNSQGINAFVLKYRVGSQGYHHPAMIQDAQYAIHYVRQHAKEYGIKVNKVGTMGFSAGGHLALMTGAFCEENHLKDLGIADDIPLRPDFIVPVYPVVSMQDELAHVRSRKNLLGCHYTQEQQDKFSMELSIPPYMPPVFLVTAKDDPVVNYQNSEVLNNSLKKARIKHSYQLYETGGHGYGMDENLAPEAGKWKYAFIKWLNGIISIKK